VCVRGVCVCVCVYACVCACAYVQKDRKTEGGVLTQIQRASNALHVHPLPPPPCAPHPPPRQQPNGVGVGQTPLTTVMNSMCAD